MGKLTAGAALLACLAFADTYERQPGVDVQHYVFRVTLSDADDAIAGETTVTIRFLKDGLTQFWLDLASPADGKGMTVSEVKSGGAPVAYTHQADRLTLTLAPPSKSGELRSFTVKYAGTAADGLKVVKNKFGERCFFSVNWPDQAHQWLPTIDHPSDKATSEFLVYAPAKYQVVANGALQETIDLGDGTRLTHWKQSVPIATWLDNIGVAQFAVEHYGTGAGVPLQAWLFHQDRDPGIATFEEPEREAMAFFSESIGPYPYEKLADVEAAGMGGGMEHASEIFFGQGSVNGRPNLSLVAHETAHQWFGDSVTEKDWDDVWLSEGFATYFQELTTEHFEGRDAFVAGLERNRRTVFNAEKRLPGVAVVQAKPWKGIPNSIVYQKGGWVLHMLRGQIGTEKFWAGIREYYRRYRDSNASTADFRRVMEEVSGADLGWFFQQWLYRAGSPVVEGGWKYDAGAKKIVVDLAQTEPGDAYRLPLEIGIQGQRMRIEKIEMTAKEQEFEIASDDPPATVELDPNVRMLIEAKFIRR
ncbi:MAG TPA: M1 family metallopeptidase [Bryobacteraceae bacterium]|nr:M1 family metallopeptidase [Bryobacteraceae bacterium]